MNQAELKERIKKGEDFHTELKERLPDRENIAKSIVCFANTDGGDLIVGVSEKNQIVGVEDLDKTMRLIDDVSLNRCEPPVTVLQETLEIKDRTVLIVRVPKGSHRPYRTRSGRFYVRSTNRCRQASREELLRIFQSDRSVFFDEAPGKQN
ncbi:ATP-binding protein [candidate division KSB1 bacterium]|nr:ATP-binding protein [candidate division KSB1 bacterium]NIR70277.1 ATP-binding protein [candidate division KSB1 bacterium]NIS26547.1 ATP-binding protein [candidate division KSB1 bacterium]NIT73310.1 ATP-binding protein [candidate division KSB1 bacterium]NIU23933.1 ATP-binding protein [candidate division KSB1 bacterium]